MHFSLLVTGLAVGQAAATGWRLDAQKYSSPYNTNNECSTDQQTGYNWDNLEPGSFGSYGSNKFSGFTCGNSFGKRDGVTKRAFQDKCITADIDKEPKIECDGKDKMTIDSYQVSASWDVDIDAHHEMPDGSTCKQTHRCTQGGNTVKNTQCAGSTKVTFKPKKGESGKNENGDSCSIGIHSIGFNCGDNGPSSSTQPAYSATSSAPAETSSASEYTSEVETTSSVPASYESSSGIPTTSTTESSPETTSDVESPSSYESSSEVPATSTTESSPETTGDVASISSYGSSEVPATSSTESSPETTSLPIFSSYANASSTLPVESSVGVPTSYAVTESSATETAPAYESSTEVSPESTAPVYESSSTVPTNSSAPAYSATTSSGAEVPTETYATPNCPDVLPQCVSTWIGQTECKDNSDSSCYCRDAEFVKNVMGCIEAWSDDDSKTEGSASYFQGICAPYIPENPAIITACPSVGKPTPASETSAAETPEETAPVYGSSSTEGSPVTSSVPEETAPTYETSPASSTEASPATTTPAELTTSTIYSTVVSTITSCAADVTDCPAASQTTAVVTSSVAISTTICPVSEAETPASSSEASPETTSSSAPVEYPASSSPASPEQVTSASSPAGEVPAPYTSEAPTSSSAASPEQITSASSPAGEVPAPYTSEVPAATSPATAPAGPSTTITYSSSVQVPCTYSTGESYGQEIPGSSTYATIDTTITVPQVVFVTSTITAAGSTNTISVGLAAGSPPAAPAYPTPTADAVGGSAKPTGSSGFGTSYVPTPTGYPVAPYEGGASVSRTSFVGFAVCAVAAFFVM
ncbi:hypothetical protein Q7P35_009233 [Cladosporium inversicolor]